jgi:flagellar hook assembly protein FlgD
VKSLGAGQQDAGRYHLVWNGTDERGSPVRSGLYFVRLHVGSAHVTRLMTLIR